MTITVDPGSGGGLARRTTDGQGECLKMPETDGDVVDLLRSWTAESGPDRTAYVEKVGGYVKPSAGKSGGAPGSAMFGFGHGRGVIMGALMAFGWRIMEPTPQRWQKRLGIGTRSGRTDTEWKNALKAEAQRRFPGCKVTLATADALLMLDYAEDLTKTTTNKDTTL